MLKFLSSDAQEEVNDALVTEPEDDETLRSFISSQFANFPLQKLLNEALNFRDEELVSALHSMLDKLQLAIEKNQEANNSP